MTVSEFALRPTTKGARHQLIVELVGQHEVHSQGELAVLLAESGEHLPVNLGNPEERTLLDLAETIKRITGTQSELVYEALPVDDPQQRRPDITRATQLLGWKPEVPLEDGLSRLLRAQGVAVPAPAR